MKKSIFILGLLIVAFSSMPMEKLDAQVEKSPWENGPRWSSVQVVYAIDQWVSDNDLLPDENGEWIMYDFIDFNQGVWSVIISWGIGGLGGEELGSVLLRIKSNGIIIEETPLD